MDWHTIYQLYNGLIYAMGVLTAFVRSELAIGVWISLLAILCALIQVSVFLSLSCCSFITGWKYILKSSSVMILGVGAGVLFE
jgi:hypothetical protein